MRFGAGLVLAGLVAAPAWGNAMDRPSEEPARAVTPLVSLVCTVSGAPKGQPDFDPAAVCRNLADRIGPALGARMVPAARLPSAATARWVQVAIRILPPGRIEAALTTRLHGTATTHPSLGVQVVDKPMGLSEIDRLARLVAQTLAER